MKAMFVRESDGLAFASWIADNLKPWETRSRDMLRALVGERVAIVLTGKGHPVVIGYADMTGKHFCDASEFQKHFDKHLVPAGSAYDCKGKGKWCYHMENAKRCKPFLLPENAVRHGRSWCEF